MPRHPAVSLFESPDLLRLVRLAAMVCGLLGLMSSAISQNATALSPDRVTFYTDPNFKGEALTVEAGASVESLDRITRTTTPKPWTFAISSVRVEGAARATVYSANGYAGQRLEISRSIPDLYAVARAGEPGATWDRAIASVAVTGPQRTIVTAPPAAGPYSPPPTTVYVVPAPARPPPPVAVRDVRPRLDYRSAELIVQRAYREVLNRPADPEGL